MNKPPRRRPCECCGLDEIRVVNSRQCRVDEPNRMPWLREIGVNYYTVRRRECQACGFRYNTIELKVEALEAIGEELGFHRERFRNWCDRRDGRLG